MATACLADFEQEVEAETMARRLASELAKLATSPTMNQSLTRDILTKLASEKIPRKDIKALKLHRLLAMVRAKALSSELVDLSRRVSTSWAVLEPKPRLQMNDGRKIINFYRERDPYGEFSNFYKRPVLLDGKEWPTTEHYFQALKFAGTPYEEELRLISGCTAVKKRGGSRSLPLRTDWEEVKDGIMFDCVLAKFQQHADLRKVLLSTGDAILVEHTKNDRYWGDGGDGSGKNMLGITLMKVREELSGQAGSEAVSAATATAAASDTPVASDAPAKLVLKGGDLLNASEHYLVHQTNCRSTYPKGLSAALFKKFPHANVYKDGTPRTPGDITVRGKPGRLVVNLHGQVGPGKPKASGDDTPQARLKYFKAGLEKIAALPDLESVAFPFKIGCGLGGGNWPEYRDALHDFSQKVRPARVVLYKLG
eukprot:m.145969 g.145969  ORF g.145969 m.145969 type:complete len:425 (+) comp17236_c0_seq2:3756-5030(+)